MFSMDSIYCAKTNELLDKAEKYMKSYEDEFISMEHILCVQP